MLYLNMNLKLTLVAAISKNNGIGYNNQIPWDRNDQDMKWFKKITSTVKDNKKVNVIIMGRKTWDSMNKHFLGNRWNIILSRSLEPRTDSSDDMGPSFSICNNLDNALLEIKNHPDYVERVFVIGGEEIYRQTINLGITEGMYITHFKKNYECDTFFPKIKQGRFHIRQVIESNPILDIIEYGVGGTDAEDQYLGLLEDILKDGADRSDRTGVGTLSVFGEQIRIRFQNGSIPLLTTKRTFWKGIVEELCWFMQGNTNVKDLKARGVHIWDGNSNREFLDSVGLTNRAEDDVGPTYGFNFRHFGAKYIDCHTDYTGQGVDQVAEVIRLIKAGGTSRRMVINLWNSSVLQEMALPPCLFCYQFYVANGKLSCMTTQRSGDMGLGVPFNLASASLLTYMIATICQLEPYELIHNIGDAHIYKNHVEALKIQVDRNPRPFPLLWINPEKEYNDPKDFMPEDFKILGYNPYPAIKMDMAV